MTFEAQQRSVQDNSNYKGAKIYCLQELEPEQWRFCYTQLVRIHFIQIYTFIVSYRCSDLQDFLNSPSKVNL